MNQKFLDIVTSKNIKLAVAESCTGGKISNILTSVSGSSSYFKGSIVSYTNEIKTNVLGIKPELIAKHSPVSSQVAQAMAVSVADIFSVEYSISTTGWAEEVEDDERDMKGNVFVCVFTPFGPKTHNLIFKGNRNKIIFDASIKAINLFLDEILP